MPDQSQPHDIVHDFKPQDHLPPKDKKITLTLVWSVLAQTYQVEVITNTTWYKPGMLLGVDVVRQICNLPNWEVTMAQSHYFSSALGAVKQVVPIP